MFTTRDTIAAIASAPGPGARGIIRISGPRTMEVLHLVLKDADDSWNRRQARRYDVVLPIDDGRLGLPGRLCLWPTHRSFTGEPLAELHLIGSPPLLNEVLEFVLMSGARPAQPGEFTLRAFLSGRIDLVQAEAVLAVIDAANDKELETALTQLAGGISQRIAALREQLLLHLADLEAGLDFVEEDIDFVNRSELTSRLDDLGEFVRELVVSAETRMHSAGRYRVVLAGLPNTGKSTLFNRLAGGEHALVSSIPGTTRDYLTAVITVGGLTFDLVDTAGWENPRDGIELAASVLRQEQSQRAHLVVWCTSADLTPDMSSLDRKLLAALRQEQGNILETLTKCDDPQTPYLPESDAALLVSARTGRGLDQLLERIVAALATGTDRSEIIGSTAARCLESLRHAQGALSRGRELVTIGAGDELIAMELRDVLNQLGRIAGQVDTDDILDRIFSRFCIGK